MTRTEAVVSALLCDPPATITGPIAQSLVRSLDLDPNYQATVAAGYVESLDEYTLRISKEGAPMKRNRTARKRAMQANDDAHYMLAYSAGWYAAADGDVSGKASAVDLAGDAAFAEGAAAYQGQAAPACAPASPALIGGIQ